MSNEALVQRITEIALLHDATKYSPAILQVRVADAIRAALSAPEAEAVADYTLHIEHGGAVRLRGQLRHPDGTKLYAHAPSHSERVAVPKGFVLVPVEPTPEMLRGAFRIDISNMLGQEAADRRAIYRAMLAAAPSAPASPVVGVEVAALVDRFLGWRLPDDFSPDCGISFTPLNHPNGWPIGTNLLTANQAKAMFEHCLRDAAPSAPAVKESLTTAGAAGRNRERDRERFPDADFNRWLDESIADGHTVWESVDVESAWSGWNCRPDYAPAVPVGDGWLPWMDCPVPADTRVTIKQRNGIEQTGEACDFVWSRIAHQPEHEVVAYRHASPAATKEG